MDDCYPDHAQNAYPDPLRRRVEQVGADRHTGDEYDVSDDIDAKRHLRHPKFGPLHGTLPGPFALCASTRIEHRARGPRTGSYRAGERLELKGMPKISRADVADFALRQLKDPAFVKKGAVISN